MTRRERRLENEWQFLQRLEARNEAIIEVTGRENICGGDWFSLLLKETSAIQVSTPDMLITTEHEIKLHFADYFPSVPIEAYLSKPVFHPNVHPENGFVCLWTRFSPGDSVIETLRQIQRVISWELFNEEADHLMQPEALREGKRRSPLPYRRIEIPDDLRNERSYAQLLGPVRRVRLTR